MTRIAAGRVERGLPQALRRCGYQTFSLYPGARRLHEREAAFRPRPACSISSIEAGLGTDRLEPDQFYYDAAAKMIERERAKGPMFMFVYLAANHFPWDYRWRPDLAPEWKDLGNAPQVDEYLRRQTMSMHDYAELPGAPEARFPRRIVPAGALRRPPARLRLAASSIPTLDDAAIAQRLMGIRSAIFHHLLRHRHGQLQAGQRLVRARHASKGPICRWSLQEAAGLPLDPSFAEQKRILERCHGLFYACAGGAEARRFNRLLIDAGLIKGL